MSQAIGVLLYHIIKKGSKISKIKSFFYVWLVSGIDLFQFLVCLIQNHAFSMLSPYEHWVIKETFWVGNLASLLAGKSEEIHLKVLLFLTELL